MAQIQVKFFTQQKKYEVSEAPFSVLGSVSGSDLCDLINKLRLEQDDESEKKSFDFIVNGEFLRSSLLQHIEEKGLSVESVLPVEYFEAKESPELKSSLSENDWISGIQLNKQHILTGTYDCSVNIWCRNSETKLATGLAHTEPIKSIAWIPSFGGENDSNEKLASTSQDQKIVLWDFDKEKNSLRPKFSCKGHSRSVESIAVNSKHETFASGSWDCTIKLWSASYVPEKGGLEDEQISSASKKKRAKLEQTGISRVPQMTVAGHTEVVSGLVWIDNNQLCSGSWDHTLRLWDMSEGKETSQLRGTKAILSVDYSKLNQTLVTGNTDRHVRLWDPRSTGSVVKSNLTSHHGWVTCVKWCKTNSNLLVTGSLDNLVKMWDIRSTKTPLFDLTAHTDKVMCLDWHKSEVSKNKIWNLFSINCNLFIFK
uniref:Ribosome biogenesis protein WDR12 homolog n=1 Tax=Phallusia mammillata TaxID=59560 RepID=A0A6F9DW84_9ASCI|nr:ribosome biogenesis protein wdr12-like [Phallusia mammillata]